MNKKEVNIEAKDIEEITGQFDASIVVMIKDIGEAMQVVSHFNGTRQDTLDMISRLVIDISEDANIEPKRLLGMIQINLLELEMSSKQ